MLLLLLSVLHARICRRRGEWLRVCAYAERYSYSDSSFSFVLVFFHSSSLCNDNNKYFYTTTRFHKNYFRCVRRRER